MPWNTQLPKAEWYTAASEEMDGLVREVQDTQILAIDTETTGLVSWRDIPLFWSLSWGNRRICMSSETLPFFKKAFSNSDKKWVFANAKYDCHILQNVGIEIKGNLVDTQVMHALLYEEQPHGLKDMANHILGWRWNDFFDTFKLGKIGDRKETVGEMLLRFEHENLNLLVEYASNDAYGTFKIYEALLKQLEAENIYSLYPDVYATMADIFWKTEMPFTKVLFKCERNGITLDLPFIKSIEIPVRQELNKVERKITQLAGRPINPKSTLQLREYFFGELKLRPIGLSKGGKSGVRSPSVDESFLEHYRGEVEMADLLLEHRDLSKILGTFVEGLQKRIDPKGRVHTRFNQDIARSGRLSSSDPNLQNIKNAEEDPFGLRKAFVPEKGYSLIVADYEQLEMRLLAAAAMEPKMIAIFEKGWDIHMGNAALVFGKRFGITYEDIQAAKKKDKKVTAEIEKITQSNLSESEKQKIIEQVKVLMTDKDHKCLFSRRAAKSVGFGWPQC